MNKQTILTILGITCVSMLIFTEFGRRMKDNGSGTDHGSGGGAFLIGDKVKGGLYNVKLTLRDEIT